MRSKALLRESGVDVDAVLTTLSDIVAAELGGAVAYTRYAALVGGIERLSLAGWFATQASESLLHARRAAEILVALGGALPATVNAPANASGTRALLKAARTHERHARDLYRHLLGLVVDRSVMLEEFARSVLAVEEEHALELERLLVG